MFADSTLTTMLPAHDVERAKEFYLDKLGLKPIEGDDGSVRFEAGDSMFMVYQSQFAGTNKATAAMFEVDDLTGCVAALKDLDVEFQEFELDGLEMDNSILTAPSGYKAAWFYDTERNIIGLAEAP